jgi:hypothetical protein
MRANQADSETEISGVPSGLGRNADLSQSPPMTFLPTARWKEWARSSTEGALIR